MTYFIQRRWGESEDNPTEETMRECLAELDEPDPEHPGTWLSHETGWTLSVYESGLVIWENLEFDSGPRYLQHASRGEALRMWLLLSRGLLNEIAALPWKEGYGPPISEVAMRKLQEESAAVTLEAQRDFYDSLGPEELERPCRFPGCVRGSVRFAVFCRTHHITSLYKQPCPFDH